MIPQNLITLCHDEYNSLTSDDTVMAKAHPSEGILEFLHAYIEEAAGERLIHKSGNYYKHSFPYLPHTDFEFDKDNTINAVIPIWTESEAHLIVFDQKYQGKYPVTWMMHHPVYNLHNHTALLGCPYDYNVEGLTKENIPNELYEKYLYNYPRESLIGLTGAAHEFKPGECIVFDNRRIHCTSNFKGTKLGLSLRYKIV